MPANHTVKAPVYRHGQDTGTNCGRACAQMIISSLTQGPPQGQGLTAAIRNTPIIVDQATLQAREADPTDNFSTPSWYTHPDELVGLLGAAPEFGGLLQMGWVLRHEATQEALIARVIASLDEGMPAVINISGTDHWVVVIGARTDAAGQLDYLELLDPLLAPTPPHTYVDNCSLGFDGVTFAEPWTLAADDLVGYSLQLGTVAPPAGMHNYAGEFVGIVYETQPARLLKPERLRKPLRPPRPSPLGVPATPALPVALLLDALQARGTAWGVAPLQRLMHASPMAAAVAVRDIQELALPYRLVTAFDYGLGYGVIAAFDGAEPNVRHFRFIKDIATHHGLAAHAGETLWWTRGFLPGYSSPYFPFRRDVVNGSPLYRRVVDDYVFTAASPI